MSTCKYKPSVDLPYLNMLQSVTHYFGYPVYALWFICS